MNYSSWYHHTCAKYAPFKLKCTTEKHVSCGLSLSKWHLSTSHVIFSICNDSKEIDIAGYLTKAMSDKLIFQDYNILVYSMFTQSPPEHLFIHFDMHKLPYDILTSKDSPHLTFHKHSQQKTDRQTDTQTDKTFSILSRE